MKTNCKKSCKTCSGPSPGPSPPTPTGSKVKVSYYFSSIDGPCKSAIEQAESAYAAPGFLNMADVEWIPFGLETFYKGSDGTYGFRCPGGTVECVWNQILTCSINVIPDKL